MTAKWLPVGSVSVLYDTREECQEEIDRRIARKSNLNYRVGVYRGTFRIMGQPKAIPTSR